MFLLFSVPPNPVLVVVVVPFDSGKRTFIHSFFFDSDDGVVVVVEEEGHPLSQWTNVVLVW